MQLTLLKGLYPDFVGKRSLFVGNGVGPTSYVQLAGTAGGDPVTINGSPFYIDELFGGAATTDGLFWVVAVPSGLGVRQAWKLVWYTIGTFNQPAAGANLSSHSLQLGGIGGQF